MKEDVIFYEYKIENGKIVKNICKGTMKGNAYYINAYREDNETKAYSRRFVYSNSFETISKSRICSFNDDMEKYSRLLIEDLEERINQERKKLAEHENLLKKIKGI